MGAGEGNLKECRASGVRDVRVVGSMGCPVWGEIRGRVEWVESWVSGRDEHVGLSETEYPTFPLRMEAALIIFMPPCGLLGHSPSRHPCPLILRTAPSPSRRHKEAFLRSPETASGTSKFYCSASQDLGCGTGTAADRHTCLSCLVDVTQKDWVG